MASGMIDGMALWIILFVPLQRLVCSLDWIHIQNQHQTNISTMWQIISMASTLSFSGVHLYSYHIWCNAGIYPRENGRTRGICKAKSYCC